jgi:hypothetical protein
MKTMCFTIYDGDLRPINYYGSVESRFIKKVARMWYAWLHYATARYCNANEIAKEYWNTFAKTFKIDTIPQEVVQYDFYVKDKDSCEYRLDIIFDYFVKLVNAILPKANFTKIEFDFIVESHDPWWDIIKNR